MPGDQQPKLQLRQKTTRHTKAGLSTVFVGLAFRFWPDKREYALVIHDGQGVVGQEQDTLEGPTPNDMSDRILARISDYAKARGHRISMVAVSGPLDPILAPPPPGLEADIEAGPSFLGRIWLDLDAIPFLALCKDTQFSLAGEAVSAVELALEQLSPTTTSIIKAGVSSARREVLVDADAAVHLYDLRQQAALTSPGLWSAFSALAAPLIKNRVHISFFSATPRGGGVALMRHSLIRIWRLAGVDVKWYVPQGDSAVFDVTKRKFHNVLQGVAPKDTKLSDKEKELFEHWINWNYDQYWRGASQQNGRSPIDVNLVVIDDPQLTPLIPLIRRDSPRTKIIFRSHIEIRSDLVDAGTNPQNEVFSYLFGFIKQADLFVSHPVKAFVPKMASDHMPVVYMPPSTDPLDGLNKPLPGFALESYRHYFNDIARASTGQQLDWQRGYILQVARFDPSKGIPDLLEGYKQFRERLSKAKDSEGRAPQLILIGHTSVDDPDATVVLHELQDTISSDEYKDIRQDIFALRAPPDDRLLDALMRGCDIACQVSTREGFEIKVTEAIHKTRWIVATKAGGIPLQIRDGTDGVLVPPGDGKAIGEALYDFYASGKDRSQTGESHGNEINRPLGGRWTDDGSGPREELFSMGNASMWMFLWNAVLGPSLGSDEKVRERLECMGLRGKPKDLKELNGDMVWDHLAVSQNSPGSKCD